jgi:hypothetical protein
MQVSRSTVNVLATLVLFASANASGNPKAIDPPPRAAGPVKAHVAKSLPKPSDKLGSQTDVPNTYFGVSGSGGSLLVGLLLGPLGKQTRKLETPK